MTENLIPSQSEDPLDLKGFLSYCLGNEELVVKLLDSFEQAGPFYLKELCEAIELGNDEEARAVCHKIRGAGLIIKAGPLLAIIAQIRQNAIDTELDLAKERLPDLEKAFAEVSDCIKSHVSTPS